MTEPTNDADPVMARVIARQLFQTWKEEQALDAKETRRWLGGSAPAWIAMVVTILTAAFVGGVVRAEISDATDTIEKHEQRLDANDTKIADIKERLVRIETKIDQIRSDR